MSQSNFQIGDHVKLKDDNFDLSIGTVIDVMPYEYNTKLPPLITVKSHNGNYGVFANKLILESEQQPDG